VASLAVQQEEEEDKVTLGTIETAVFALFGLLIAFTFSGAAMRFQEKLSSRAPILRARACCCLRSIR
jgi:hypothetical protein